VSHFIDRFRFAPIAKELALAYGRINGAPARRLRWLLNFSELILDSLSEGRLADLRWELVVFALNRKPEEMKSRFGIYYELTLLTLPVPVLKDMPLSEIEKALPKAETEEEYKKSQEARESEERKGGSLWLVKEFQTTMREIFTTLFSGEPWQFTRPARNEAVVLTQPARVYRRRHLANAGDRPHQGRMAPVEKMPESKLQSPSTIRRGQKR
jgi:hypothetical protein